MNRLIPLIPFLLIGMNSCVVIEPTDPNINNPAIQPPENTANYGQPLTIETSPGMVTVREGSEVLTSIRTASPNVEQTRWYAEQEQIVVKSRGNHGPATVELFDSRTGSKLGTVMAYEAANGPAWARSMAE